MPDALPEAAAVGPRRVELRHEDLPRARRCEDRHHVVEVRAVNIMGPVVERPHDRHLDQLVALEVLHHIGHIVALKRAVVEKAQIGEELGGVLRKRAHGSAIAARSLAGELFQALVGPLEPVFLTIAGKGVGQLVHPAVVGDLVAALDHPLDGLGVLFRRPAGNEEGERDVVGLEHAANARHRDFGAVAQVRHRHQPGIGILGMGQVQDAVGIHVPGEADRAARPVGPRHRVFDHRELALCHRMSSLLPYFS